MLQISGNGRPEYDIKKDVPYDAGPPVDSAAPLVTNKPVPGRVSAPYAITPHYVRFRDEPMEPPIAIICRWRPFNFVARPEFAVRSAAAR